MSRFTLTFVGLLGLSTLIACDKAEVPDDTSVESDTDTDSDTDSDTDADADADSDADSDTDADADTDVSEIYLVRTGTYAAGDGAEVAGDTVTVTGALMMDKSKYGFFISDGVMEGYHAIQVYVPTSLELSTEWKAGDVVQVTGEYLEYNTGTPADSMAEIVVETDGDIVVGTETMVEPGAMVLSVSDLIAEAEGWESGLVRIENVTVSDGDLGYGEWEVTDGTNTFRVDDYMYDFADTGNVLKANDTFASITGTVYYSYGNYKLLPRGEADLAGFVSYEIPCPAAKCPKDMVAGDLLVTEMMYNPADYSDDYGEYVEIYNNTGSTVNIEGLVLEDDGGNTATVALTDPSAVFAAGDYIVVAVSDGSNWQYTTWTADGFYGTMALGNGGDAVSLTYGSTTITTSPEYSTSAGKGYAVSVDSDLMLTQVVTEDAASWCAASSNIEGNEYGTPGAANDSCAP